MTWYLANGEPFENAPIDYAGFIYLITEKSTGKKYIGKKLFWAKRGKKKVESNWKKYTGSSKILNERIKEYGIDNYHKEILKLCETRGQMSYEEIKYQICEDVLNNDNFFNQFISCRINASHLPSNQKYK